MDQGESPLKTKIFIPTDQELAADHHRIVFIHLI